MNQLPNKCFDLEASFWIFSFVWENWLYLKFFAVKQCIVYECLNVYSRSLRWQCICIRGTYSSNNRPTTNVITTFFFHFLAGTGRGGRPYVPVAPVSPTSDRSPCKTNPSFRISQSFSVFAGKSTKCEHVGGRPLVWALRPVPRLVLTIIISSLPLIM